jgi:mono/diheme cytochrome c family protein
MLFLEKTKLFGILLLFTVFFPGVLYFLFGYEQTAISPFPEDPLKGSKIFVSKGCIKCHAIWGIGDDLGPDLAKVSADKTLLQLAGMLWSHSPKMIEIMQERGVSRPIFTPQEIGDLMGYIYYFNYFDQPGNFMEGEKLFNEKGCSICHTVGGRGGKNFQIPLDEYGKYISPSFLVTGLWNHSQEILFEMKKLGIKQPEFVDQELNHLIAYFRGAAVNENGDTVYAEPGSPKRGKEVFEEKRCNACHAVLGVGGKIGSDLGRGELRLSLTEVAGKLWSHSSLMWEEMKRLGIDFPIFTPEETADIISYLYFIQFYDEQGDIKEGKKLFREKTCIFCHALEGEGENIGPDLTDSEGNLSPIFLASAMWNHAVIMEDMLEDLNLEWPRFSGNQMRDVVSYIRYAKETNLGKVSKKSAIPEERRIVILSENRIDPELAKQGKKIYEAKACNACHSINGKESTMGGNLAGITNIRDLEWLFNFIKDPKSMFDKDGLAKQILKEFKNIPMPNQGLSDEDVIAIIEYLKESGRTR